MDLNFFKTGISSAYDTLRGPAGQPQNAVDTIQKLADRLSQASLLSDRRAATLTLKGLARDCKADVGRIALEPLLAALQTDGKADPDICRALLETLVTLCECEVPEGAKASKDLVGLRHTDTVLANPQPTHTLFEFLQEPSYYVKFTAVQLLSTLLSNRAHLVQQHFLTCPIGVAAVLDVLQKSQEIIRNEALLMVQTLVSSNADIQKILAFQGVFELVFGIIQKENGIDGGLVVQDCLGVVDALLRFNVSNQNYFRELSLPASLPPLLGFPNPPPAHDQPIPQEFSLQFWDAQRLTNANAIVSIMKMVAGGKGAITQTALHRCLIELSLSGNAPTALKTRAIRALPTSTAFDQILTPYVPVPDTNGEEWDRLPQEPALSVLMALALQGEFAGVIPAQTHSALREGLELRAAAVTAFDNYMTSDINVRLWLLQELGRPTSGAAANNPYLALLNALTDLPESPLTRSAAQRTHFASLMFTSLIRHSSQCKEAAKDLLLANANPGAGAEDEDDPPPTLVSTIAGSLALSFRPRSLAREQGNAGEVREWDRVMVGYLALICVWCWESPPTVREVLEEGGALGTLIEPITHTSEVDVVVQGLCAFLLAICYEYDREPGEITRSTLYPILQSRIGQETLISRITRLREDDRFKMVGPDSIIIDVSLAAEEGGGGTGSDPSRGEAWLDWSFVEFVKGNYYTVQRAVLADPDTLPPSSSANSESVTLIASLKEAIQKQANEAQDLRNQLKQLTKEREDERHSTASFNETFKHQSGETEELRMQLQQITKERDDERQSTASLNETIKRHSEEAEELRNQLQQVTKERDDVRQASSGQNAQTAGLSEKIATLEKELKTSETKTKDAEKEQEDLLVLLEELSVKRRRDKAKMREKGIEVSEDEEGEDDEDDEDEDDEDEEEEEEE